MVRPVSLLQEHKIHIRSADITHMSDPLIVPYLLRISQSRFLILIFSSATQCKVIIILGIRLCRESSDTKDLDIERKSYINNESAFRYDFNENPMAVDKLAQGIRSFDVDAGTLKRILRS